MALLPPPASSLSSLTPLPPSLASKSTRAPPNLAFPKRRRSPCSASWQELVGVAVFSAVKAIANSALGESLQCRSEERKKAALEDSSRFKELSRNARNRSLWYGEERPRWLGPIPYDYPAHLTGELPGDYGFDVAGLGEDPVAFQRYFNFEILHARWAMLGAFGALVPEILDLLGAFHFVEPVWWRVGYSKLQVKALFRTYLITFQIPYTITSFQSWRQLNNREHGWCTSLSELTFPVVKQLVQLVKA